MRFLAFVFGALTFAAGQSLTIEKLIDIKHPSDPIWSPDGTRVVFIWDRAGVSNLYLVDAAGIGSARAAHTFSRRPGERRLLEP